LHWLKQAEAKQITQAQAAERMKVSERWVRKLLSRRKREGDRVMVHGLRGQRSNRRLAGGLRRRAITLIEKQYRDFGPTLVAEYLEQQHGFKVGKETVRKWMIEGGLWRARPRRVTKVHDPCRASLPGLHRDWWWKCRLLQNQTSPVRNEARAGLFDWS
jgi:transposase